MSSDGFGILLQEWLRWPWVAAYVVILIIHLQHAASKGDQRRAWHSVHVVMAAGMFYMFLPMALKIPYARFAWTVAFVVLAGYIGAGILRAWTRQQAVNLLWLLSLGNMLAMAYMFAFPVVAVAPLTYFFIVYFSIEMLAWFAGYFDELASERRGPLPFAVGPRSPEASPCAEPLAGVGTAELRVSLAVMAAGMAYMFVAMQFGM